MNKLMNDNPQLISIGTTTYVHNQVGKKKKNDNKTVATYQYIGKVQENIFTILPYVLIY